MALRWVLLSTALVCLLTSKAAAASAASAAAGGREREEQPLAPSELPHVIEAAGKHAARVGASSGRRLIQLAVVNKGPKFAPDYTVAKDGTGQFRSVSGCIRYMKQNPLNPKPILLYIKRGVYYENVTIPPWLPMLTMVGDAGGTTITFDKYSAKLGANGAPLGTANTGTLAVLADDFTMINMNIQNSVPRPAAGIVGQQAVAFRSAGNRTLVYNCSFYSFQDTLYAQKGNQYYLNSFIYGSIDFIFGYSKTIFDGCTMFMDSTGYAGITAQHRMRGSFDTCFVIMNSYVTGKGQGWLGRSWGIYACTIFAYTYMDQVVLPAGWNDFGVPARVLTSFFAEYQNSGIGANLDGRVWWQKVLTARDVKRYLTTDWIGLSAWRKPLPLAPGSGVVPVTKPPPKAPKNCHSNSRITVVRSNECYLCCSLGPLTNFRPCMHACRQIV